MATQQSPASLYPLLSAAFPANRQKQIVAMGHTEDRRWEIALRKGLETLAVEDQFVRALLELNIESADAAQSARQAIDNALAYFSTRGFPTGQSPTPAKIKRALKSIASSMTNIERDLNLLMMARRGAGIGEVERSDSLEQIQHAILGSIAANILPSSLTYKFTDEDIVGAMPSTTQSIGRNGFTNSWVGGFTKVAHTAEVLAEAFDDSELSKPTRSYDIYFVRFIWQLSVIYSRFSGKVAHAPDRNATQACDWRGPFSRFVEAVWPLTPEGSGGLGNNRRCPTNKKIREALNQSALLTASEELQ
jgi:hypothetical protein